MKELNPIEFKDYLVQRKAMLEKAVEFLESSTQTRDSERRYKIQEIELMLNLMSW